MRYRKRLKDKNKLPVRQPTADDLISAWKHFRAEASVSFRELNERMRDVIFFAVEECNGNVIKANNLLLDNPKILEEVRLRRTGNDSNTRPG